MFRTYPLFDVWTRDSEGTWILADTVVPEFLVGNMFYSDSDDVRIYPRGLDDGNMIHREIKLYA